MMSPEMNAWMTIAMRLMNTHLSPGIDTPRGILIHQKKFTGKIQSNFSTRSKSV